MIGSSTSTYRYLLQLLPARDLGEALDELLGSRRRSSSRGSNNHVAPRSPHQDQAQPATTKAINKRTTTTATVTSRGDARLPCDRAERDIERPGRLREETLEDDVSVEEDGRLGDVEGAAEDE